MTHWKVRQQQMRDRRVAARKCIKCGGPHDGKSRRVPGKASQSCPGCVDYMVQSRLDKAANASEGKATK